MTRDMTAPPVHPPDDIVDLLHSIGRLHTMDLGTIPAVARRAADEIERLRASSNGGTDVNSPEAALWAETMRLKSENEHAKLEIERLRAEAKNWVTGEIERLRHELAEAYGQIEVLQALLDDRPVQRP